MAKASPNVERDVRVCERCGAEYRRPHRYALTLWAKRRYCGRECGRLARFVDGQGRSGRPWTETPCRTGWLTSSRRVQARSYRDLWARVVGPLDAADELHHLCRNRRCDNLDHLIVVSRQEHDAIHVALRTHCKRGHEFTPENVYVRPLGRECRACMHLRATGQI